MRIFILIGLLLLTFAAKAASTLETLIQKNSNHAIVLVGGFGTDFKYFTPWMDSLAETNDTVLGFAHDHSANSMEVGATALAFELNKLASTGVTSVTILAHSMGGLVANRAVHLLDSSSALTSIKLRTYGTPYGGFFLANFARWLPGSEFVAKKLGFPMGVEIGSQSDFMLSLCEPLPSNANLVVYESIDDTVATPESSSAVEQYSRVVAQASAVHSFSKFGHDDFVRALTFVN